MGGTSTGGKAAAATNKAKYGDDFYGKIGAMGGKLGKTGGFHYSKVNGLTTHIEAGKKGGSVSRRRPATPEPEPPQPTPHKRFNFLRRRK